MKLKQWTITELAALGAGSIENMSAKQPLCWTPEAIKDMWRALGKPRRFTAKQVLDLVQGRVTDAEVFRLLCVMLPARVINKWLGQKGRKLDMYSQEYAAPYFNQDWSMPYAQRQTLALEKLAEILD